MLFKTRDSLRFEVFLGLEFVVIILLKMLPIAALYVALGLFLCMGLRSGLLSPRRPVNGLALTHSHMPRQIPGQITATNFLRRAFQACMSPYRIMGLWT